MSGAKQIDLSVILVNYNVAPLVVQAVASLERQAFAGPDGSDGRLEILVIDNASDPEDVECLEPLQPSVVLLRSDRNVGFAAASNQGIERATGRYLCFLNPDTRVLDGALECLLQYCYRHPEVGAVGPRIWADDERTLLIPPGDPPTLSFLLGQIVAAAVPSVGAGYSRRWHRRAMTVWRSPTPLRVPTLSGACILTPRAVIDRVGGFDPGYFLYWEDMDWYRRVRLAGYQLASVPGAEIVHYYNQSAKLDPQGAHGHALRSQARFVKAHYGLPGTLLYRKTQAMGDRLTRWRPPAAPSGMIDLGRLEEPPRLRVTGAKPPGELAIQIGYDWLFVPSATAFVREADYQLSSSTWDRMQPGRYYARALDAETLRPLGLWSWVKEEGAHRGKG